MLPTLSDRPRLTRAEKEDYFKHFMEKEPIGSIDMRWTQLYGDTAIDSGLYSFCFKRTGQTIHGRYTFTYKRVGQDWTITSHHSSLLPGKP